uniref:Pheromone binding protein 3 n=1 Tax=Conogethes punctiferalis TaxID=1133088 RepID=A0A0M4FQ35_CONPF|nr:pheromone binding protein 3 [Conogethes punctiferalis]
MGTCPKHGNMKGFFVTLLVVFMGGKEVEMSSDGMKQLTTGFLKVLGACKTELGLSDGILSDMYHLWKEEYEQVSRDSGCMFSCMSKKLDILDGDGKIHHDHTKEYVLSNGGGEDLARQLINVAHDCEKQQESLEDECDRMLEIAKCLRRNIKDIQWTPKVEVIITEIVADM